jgi:hypothetical protein
MVTVTTTFYFWPLLTVTSCLFWLIVTRYFGGLWHSELPLIVKIFLLFWTKNYALGPKFKLNIKNLKNFKGFNFLYVVLTISIVYIKILISIFSVIWPKIRPLYHLHIAKCNGICN